MLLLLFSFFLYKDYLLQEALLNMSNNNEAMEENRVVVVAPSDEIDGFIRNVSEFYASLETNAVNFSVAKAKLIKNATWISLTSWSIIIEKLMRLADRVPAARQDKIIHQICLDFIIYVFNNLCKLVSLPYHLLFDFLL